MNQVNQSLSLCNDNWEQVELNISERLLKRFIDHLQFPVFFDSNSNARDFKNTKPAVDIISGNPIKVVEHSSIDHIELPLLSPLPKHFISVPFVAGYAGYLSYEFGKEALIGTSKFNKAPSDTSFVALYSWTLAIKHRKAWLTFSPLCHSEEREKLKSLIKQLDSESQSQVTYKIDTDFSLPRWNKSQSKKEYMNQINRIKEYILSGDCYQANFTQRFESKCNANALDLYFHYRNLTQTPFSFYIDTGNNQQILSFSPERFLQISQKKIKTQPIKGTIANNGDDNNKNKLKESAKDQAENLMIVDLLRNDLSRVSKKFSVKVEKLFSLESFNNVHHLVSDILGELNDDITEFEAFLSCFPGGSITGAPKKRAMEIIEETEQCSRDAYCGSAFYWNYDGNLDSNILIRTVVKHSNQLYCWGGGGITSGSDPAEEYKESLQKVVNITGINT